MTWYPILARGAFAMLLSAATVAACAAAAPGGEAPATPPTSQVSETYVDASTTPTGDAPAKRPESAERPPVDASVVYVPTDAQPQCPFGSLEDPHRGFVRCLGPEERDAQWRPIPESAASAVDAGESSPSEPPSIEIGAPKFENGDVPRTEKALTKASRDIAQCVATNGGLTGATGTLTVRFLVRSRGRAEGVEIVSAKGISEKAGGCIRKLLKNKAIGAPTSDPVGVSVTIGVKPSK